MLLSVTLLEEEPMAKPKKLTKKSTKLKTKTAKPAAGKIVRGKTKKTAK